MDNIIEQRYGSIEQRYGQYTGRKLRDFMHMRHHEHLVKGDDHNNEEILRCANLPSMTDIDIEKTLDG